MTTYEQRRAGTSLESDDNFMTECMTECMPECMQRKWGHLSSATLKIITPIMLVYVLGQSLLDTFSIAQSQKAELPLRCTHLVLNPLHGLSSSG